MTYLSKEYFDKKFAEMDKRFDQQTLAVGFIDSPGVGALLGQADFFQAHKSPLNDTKSVWR